MGTSGDVKEAIVERGQEGLIYILWYRFFGQGVGLLDEVLGLFRNCAVSVPFRYRSFVFWRYSLRSGNGGKLLWDGGNGLVFGGPSRPRR